MLTTGAVDSNVVDASLVKNRSEVSKSLRPKLRFIVGLTQERQLLVQHKARVGIPVITVRVGHEQCVHTRPDLVCGKWQRHQWVIAWIRRILDGRTCTRIVKHGVN